MGGPRLLNTPNEPIDERGDDYRRRSGWRRSSLSLIKAYAAAAQVDVPYIDEMMKEAWMGSAKGTLNDLADSLDEFLTLEELKQALRL